MSRSIALISGLLAFVVIACERPTSWPPNAAAFRAGEEACAECRMFVSDARFAVQSHSRAGAVEWFDDLGCLLARDEGATEPEGVFVHDFATDAWVRGDHGIAVRVPGLDSPMGYGWSVHATEVAARATARSADAELVPLSELLRRAPSDAQQRLAESTATANPDGNPR